MVVWLNFLERIVFKVLIFLSLVCTSTHIFAASCNLGKVKNIVGVIWLQHDDTKTLLDYDAKLCEGDRILSSMNSIAELKLRDGSVIIVGKESEFVLKRYEFHKTTSKEPDIALFELVKGAFRSITGAITKKPNHRYEVQTVVATMGIRGTDFWGGYGLTENGLDVLMIDGHGVYVVNSKGEQVELDKPGLGTTVLPNQAPKAPIKWGDAKFARAMATVTP
jgi:hypothetical protein